MLEPFFKELTVVLEPFLSLIHVWELGLDDVPESWRMVGFDEVSEFEDDDVVDDKHGGLDETPVEMCLVSY